jgi:Tfp pilus assembly protein PilX
MMMDLRKNQRGSALLIVMLVMAMMGIIGFAALESVTRDQRVAGFLKRKKIAFFAAEAGVSSALYALSINGDPTFAQATVGNTSWFEHGLPTYSMDTSGGAASAYLGPGKLEGYNMQTQQGGTTQFSLEMWQVNVVGEAVGGTVSRIQVANGTLKANN